MGVVSVVVGVVVGVVAGLEGGLVEVVLVVLLSASSLLLMSLVFSCHDAGPQVTRGSSTPKHFAGVTRKGIAAFYGIVTVEVQTRNCT